MNSVSNKPIYILGISAYYHDSAACLLKDGQIIAAVQEERFSRLKHDPSFPTRSIQYCLQEAGINTKDISYVGFYEKPFLKFERLLLTYLNYAPRGMASFLKAMPVWLKEKIFMKNLLLNELNYNGDLLFVEHHESHAASAFFPSPFENAAILTMDGVGEWTTTSIGAGEGNKIHLDLEMRFPHSLGLLYSAFTYYCGFRVNSGEYKLMGLAPYGEPKYTDLIYKELIDVKDDGSFRLNMDYFNYCVGLTMTNNKFHRLFGRCARKPESPIMPLDMDLASSIQEVTQDIMVKAANHAYKITGKENLCLAGGVALNCVGNGKIIEKTKFKNVWVQPAAGDAGGALGTALFIWYQYLNSPRISDGRRDLQSGSCLGPGYSDNEIEDFLKSKGIPFKKYEGESIFDQVALLIASEKVIGLVQGRMEFGPRALGNRSIIGDARSLKMQEEMNVRIKFRESFRPFAPSILKERLHDYFELPFESPYMLFVGKLKESQIDPHSRHTPLRGLDRLKVKRSSVPAITHVDYSARIQTVDRERNPFFYKIIETFNQKTGCPVIINTSFNIRGEPIVATLEDAYRCFMCTNMDYLVLNRFILDKSQQPDQHKYKKHQISQILD
ncbi:MAG: carbamoyltransferase [Candidatus Omnitrophica bacterium]|nr:carbamoyltransferase [Candidatus Omnitrophota bacterium]